MSPAILYVKNSEVHFNNIVSNGKIIIIQKKKETTEKLILYLSLL